MWSMPRRGVGGCLHDCSQVSSHTAIDAELKANFAVLVQSAIQLFYQPQLAAASPTAAQVLEVLVNLLRVDDTMHLRCG